MSKTLSLTSPAPSSDASAEARPELTRDAALAAHLLLDRGLCGIVWLDEDLVAVEACGRLVASVEEGQPIGRSMLALIGLDDALRALRDEPGTTMSLPNVTEAADTGGRERRTIVVEWVPAALRYLMYVSLVIEPTEFEIELGRQMRLRLIAEAELAAKSRALERANQELALANQDLEEFAYVISHDLRAPLRALRYLATDAQAAHGVGDDRQAKVLIDQFRGQIARMNDMMTGLLEYARLGRKAEIVETIDTLALAETVVEAFGNHTGMRIEIEGAWPQIDSLAAPLDMTLRNLVDNAIKHHDRASGTIRVSARRSGGMLEIAVDDDGPGIDPEWREAVFQPFRKAGADERPTEGAGIGLALVRKAVERIGGSVELLATPPGQRGTTFIVRWPMQIA